MSRVERKEREKLYNKRRHLKKYIILGTIILSITSLGGFWIVGKFYYEKPEIILPEKEGKIISENFTIEDDTKNSEINNEKNYENYENQKKEIKSSPIINKEIEKPNLEKKDIKVEQIHLENIEFREYVVKKEDTLYKISNLFYKTSKKIEDIKKWNNLKKDNDLKIGMILKLAPYKNNDMSQEAPKFYIVEQGETLFAISRKFYKNETTVEAIKVLNDIVDLQLNQKIQLP